MKTISLPFVPPFNRAADLIGKQEHGARRLLLPSNGSWNRETYIMIRERDLVGPLGVEIRRAWWL